MTDAQYCENDWSRLMQGLRQRFPQASVAVFPTAPLQLPVVLEAQ